MIRWLLIITLLLPSNIYAEETPSCNELTEKLRHCDPYHCIMPVEGIASHAVHEIKGRQPDETCHYITTTPQGFKSDCRYSHDARMAMVRMAEYKEKTGAPSPDATDRQRVIDAMNKECKIFVPE